MTRGAPNHDVPDWSIQRDIAAATTVEPPPGTTQADVESVRAVAVPVGGSSAPAGWSIDVTDVNRAFFLSRDDLPQPSSVNWHGAAKLTPDQPAAVLWSAPGTAGGTGGT